MEPTNKNTTMEFDMSNWTPEEIEKAIMYQEALEKERELVDKGYKAFTFSDNPTDKELKEFEEWVHKEFTD